MKITIDNFDGAGARDYTPSLDAEHSVRIHRRLNQPEEMEAWLVAESPQIVAPASGARVIVLREDGHKLFTGYLTAAPGFEYLGWGQGGPVFGYRLTAQSDEAALNRGLLPARTAFVSRTAGDALRQWTGTAAAGAFTTAAIQDLEILPALGSGSRRKWSEAAAGAAMRARAVCRAHDGNVSLAALGATTHTLDESDASFCHEKLKLRAPSRLLNDATVLGRVEPRAYVRDYFLGDGLTLSFNLSATPFTRSASTLVEEEYTGAALDPLRWVLLDPAAVATVSAGKLRINGGNGFDGQTTVQLTEQVEIGGAVTLQHGEVAFTAASRGVIGGLYSGGVLRANCFAGFGIFPSGAQSVIRPLINGVETGTALTTIAGHKYALTTRLIATETYRSQQVFHSSAHPAGSGRGGAAVASSVRVVLEVHDIDPANPGSLAAASVVLHDDVVAASPGFCVYALVNAEDLNCAITFTRLLRAVDAEVRSAIPGFAARTRLVGTIAEGAECVITQQPELQFFTTAVPVPNEAIMVRYRGRGRALARIVDAASMSAQAKPGDDGARADTRRVLQPAARTSVDCENAALALLDDSTRQAWTGEYETVSDFLPGGAASDPLPGDAIVCAAPSRGANFTAILREVEIELFDPANDRGRYTLRFANDAADPLAFSFEQGFLREPLDVISPGQSFAGNLPDAAITSVTSTTVSLDAGIAPIAGGGIEARRSDFGWGQENDRNLIGRFTSKTFTAPRLARVQDYYLRQYDNSAPPKYSRYSTHLHLDYPL